MSDKLNEAIQDIAVKHGVVLSKDDPILILQTMNERLLEENRKAQQAMLAEFREEMENISSQWKDDANIKAGKVLNAALTGSKETMTRLLHESANESAHNIKRIISETLSEAYDLTQQTRKFSLYALSSSAVILTIACFFIFFVIIH